jgi:ABC-2 type transport system permease protein
MKSVIALAGKDLRLLVRDRAGFFFVFFFPLIYAVFFGTIFSSGSNGMSGMRIAVVDEDQTDSSQRFVAALAAATELTVTSATREEAVDMVRRGKQTAYVIIPEGFSASRDRIFQGEGIHLEVGVDPGRQAESGMIQGVLTRHAFSVMQDIMGDRAAMRRQVRNSLEAVAGDGEMGFLTKTVLNRFLGELDKFIVELPEEEGEESAAENGENQNASLGNWNPINITFTSVAEEKSGPRTSFDITMPQAFVWMFLGCAAAFAISLVTERTRGTLMRLRSAPITLAHILAGKALACFTTTMAGLFLLFAFFSLVFDVRPDSYAFLLLAFFCSSIAFVGVMMLISVMGKTEAAVGGIGWALLIVMAMLGGGMVPLAFMPSWMQPVSNFSFVKWTVLAMEGAVWRDFSFEEMMFPCGILLGIGAASFVVGVRVFKATAD